MLLLWKIAFRNLFRNGRRNLITGTSIALGLMGVSLLGGYILRMERYLATQSVYLSFTGHVIVYPKNGLDLHISNPGKYSLDKTQQAALEEFQDPRIERRNPMLNATGLISNGCQSFPYSLVAVNPEVARWTRAHPAVETYVNELGKISQGKGFWELPLESHPINITKRLSSSLKKEKMLGETGSAESSAIVDCTNAESKKSTSIDPSAQLLGLAFEGGLALGDVNLAGLYSTGMAFSDDTALMLPLNTAQTIYNTDRITAYSFFLSQEKDISSFMKDLSQYLQSKGVEVDIYPFSDEKISAFYVGGMKFNWVMLYFFIVLVCGVVAVSITNSLYISLMERKTEFGTLRSIGFNQRIISQLLIVENLLLFFCSLVPGLALTYLVKTSVNSSNIRFEIPGLAGDLPFRLFITPQYLSMIVILIGLLVLVVTHWGSKHFLRKPVLELLGTSSC